MPTPYQSTPGRPRPLPASIALPGLRLVLGPVLVLTLGSAACGSDDPGSGSDGGASAQDPCPEGFLPLKTGTTWKYFVRDASNQVATEKETVVEALVDVPMKPGTMAYRMRTKKGILLRDETVSWQSRVGNAVVRHQETSYKPGVAGAAPVENLNEWWSPSKLRISESPDHLRKGATWMETYMEISVEAGARTERMRTDRWTVIGVNEEVTVPKGTYKTLHLHRQGSASANTDDGADKHYWFACNVGKVRETGGQSEELTAYMPAP
jgi:hypothetical protein